MIQILLLFRVDWSGTHTLRGLNPPPPSLSTPQGLFNTPFSSYISVQQCLSCVCLLLRGIFVRLLTWVRLSHKSHTKGSSSLLSQGQWAFPLFGCTAHLNIMAKKREHGDSSGLSCSFIQIVGLCQGQANRSWTLIHPQPASSLIQLHSDIRLVSRCVLLVGFAKWPLMKAGRRCQAVRRIPPSDNLQDVCLWIDWCSHRLLSSSPTSSLSFIGSQPARTAY